MSGTTDDAVVAVMQEGRWQEVACGLLASGILVATLFLADAIQDDGSVAPADQERHHQHAMLIKAKAEHFGGIAAAKLCSDKTDDEKKALADSLACAIVALVAMEATAEACGGTAVAARGMVLMAAHAATKDLAAFLKGGA